MDSMTSLIITAVVAVLIFLVCRSITLWYFKITPILETLKRIAEHLAALRTETITHAPSTLGGIARLAKATPK